MNSDRYSLPCDCDNKTDVRITHAIVKAILEESSGMLRVIVEPYDDDFETDPDPGTPEEIPEEVEEINTDVVSKVLKLASGEN